MINIKVENKEIKVPEGILALDVCKQAGLNDLNDIFAVKINGEVFDTSTPLISDCDLKALTWADKEGKAIFWHSSSHLMAAAIEKLFPQAKFTIGPGIEQGFYYDIDFEDYVFSSADFEKVEKYINELANMSDEFVRKNMNKQQAMDFFRLQDNNYKLELIRDLQDENISFYKSGSFIDLCRGPHISNTGKIKAVKLLKVSGAYWRADQTKKQLTRIYGISFPSQELLEEFLFIQEEAEKRDHRKIGKNLDLFSFHPSGPGFVFWHDKGMILKNQIIEYWREEHKKLSYQEVNTPILLDRSLWEKSGHWNLYKDNMYTTTIDDADFAIKPMNCPGGILLFKDKPHSYKELPLKMGELGLVHRHELSGVLHGLMRVRQFVQDDAHIYCTIEQLADQIEEIIDLALRIFGTFSFSDYKFSISLRSEKKKDKYLGDDETWNLAENVLKTVLNRKNLTYQLQEGEAKFYGPSIDLLINDSLRREWQCSTIQVDFNLPKRFELEYVKADGTMEAPIMLHRTILGSLERFIGVLIEHFSGAFPLWLAPVQTIVLPISDKHIPYSKSILASLKDSGIRTEFDESSATLNKKIRNAELQKIPYIIVVGDLEVQNKNISVRSYNNKTPVRISLLDFIEELKNEILDKGAKRQKCFL